MTIETLVQQAQDGNREALEQVVVAIQDKIYYLALRMLANVEDAQDATQEIMIRVITKLSTFQFNSKFQTWVFRVATNYLLDARKARAKEPDLSFDDFQNDLEEDLEEPAELEELVEYPLLLNEVRISCTMAMLLCLNKKLRLAYILGDIFQLNHTEASQALGVSKVSYRQQLARARKKVLAFTTRSCGLVSEQARCSCRTKMKGAIKRNRIDPARIQLAQPGAATHAEIQQKIAETQTHLKTVTLQTAMPHFHSPEDFGKMMEGLLSNSID
ncbi:MAG: RNA polymerase sigma factor [Chloroflexota bacterium]